jgi:hypothetical protein
MRNRFLIAAIAASALLAGCSGGGGSSPSPVSPGNPGGGSSPTGPTTQSQAVEAIGDANAIGSPLKDFADFDKTIDYAPAAAQSEGRVRATASGACNNGVEFFAPDKNGDPNSTETVDFYDSACTIEARDVVRIYSQSSSSSETVNLTDSLFAPGNSTPIATQSETHAISNATFNQYGYPIVADGYDLVAGDSLNIATAKTIVSDRELVMEPASNATNDFCADSAGYNATGFQRLDKTFGWQGGVLSGGTRTVNSDGSVTWTATHAGTVFKGAIGGLSVATGVQNTACPISTPMFTLAGGTAIGTYSVPVVATFAHGMLESLSITGATLANGDTLNVTTNASEPPSSNLYITGTVSNGSTQIATFAVDAYGDGTLTVSSNGGEYVIVDWHVVR